MLLGLELSLESVGLAAAFLLGAVFGAVATLRLARAVIQSIGRARRRIDLDDDER